MIRFTVIWAKDITEQLTILWLQAKDRRKVTQDSFLIDLELSTDAHIKGIDLHEGLRKIVQHPLAVTYTVNLPDRIVRVVGLGILK